MIWDKLNPNRYFLTWSCHIVSRWLVIRLTRLTVINGNLEVFIGIIKLIKLGVKQLINQLFTAKLSRIFSLKTFFSGSSMMSDHKVFVLNFY